MRFRKAILFASLMLLCFLLPAQSAKADTINTIIVNDNTDTITVTTDTTGGRVGPSGSTVPTCGGANVELCGLTLSAPANSTVDPSRTTLLPTFLLREPGT